MTIHGMVWWIYPPGQGPSGRIPGWDVQEIVYGDLSQSLNSKVHDIDTSGLPDSVELNKATPEDVAKVSAENADKLNEWTLLPASDASRGEAQTALEALLVAGEVPGLEDPSTRVFTYTFETGGKPERESDGVWDRITNRVTNTLRVFNPTHYAVVQFVPAKPQVAVAGQPPPVPAPDPDAQVISAVLVRDIGQRRLPAALITTGSALMLGLLCYMLHVRDRRVAEHRSAPVPATTGG
jgi:hypothetical protein